MRNTLIFNVRNQNIGRVDNFLPVRYSRNYLYTEFDFKTPDWNGVTKTAIFKSAEYPNGIPVILGDTDTCLVPWEVLESTEFKVSVYGGDLITVDSAPVKLYESGYRTGDIPDPTPDIYAQLITLLESKADGLEYKNNILKLLSGETELARVTITGGSGGGTDAREIELQNDGTYIQWRYVDDLSWTNLVALEDITGPQGEPGIQGEQGEAGTAGADGKDGADGRGIISSEITLNGHLQINYSDGTNEDVGKVVGEDGITPNLQIGTVETLEAGSDATASVTGTAGNPLLNLGIPRGAAVSREWALLGELDISVIGGGDIELTDLDGFTEFCVTWETVLNESTVASGYNLLINNINIANSVLPIQKAGSTTNFGWGIVRYNGLIWEVQRSAGANAQTNTTMANSNALFPYNYVFDVGKADAFKLVAPLLAYRAVSGIIKIYGR